MTQMSEVTVTFPSAVHPAPSAMECIISNTKYALVCLRIAHCTNMCSAHCAGMEMTLTFPSAFDPVKSVFTI